MLILAAPQKIETASNRGLDDVPGQKESRPKAVFSPMAARIWLTGTFGSSLTTADLMRSNNLTAPRSRPTAPQHHTDVDHLDPWRGHPAKSISNWCIALPF
jgi:hypothetical protein